MLTHATSDLKARLQSELLSGESIHWADQPNLSVIFHKEDLFLIPFSLMWGGFSIFWEAGVLGLWGSSAKTGATPPLFMALWGIPFVLLGQYLIWGRFLHAAWKKKNIYYALTNKRALILCEGPSRSLNAAPLDALPAIQKQVRKDGIGTVIFGAMSDQAARYTGSWSGMATTGTPTFTDINDAEAVYRLACRLREEARTTTRF